MIQLGKSALILCIILFLNFRSEAQEYLKKGRIAPYSGMIYDTATYKKLRLSILECQQVSKDYADCIESSSVAIEHIAEADTLAKDLNALTKPKKTFWQIIGHRPFWYGVAGGTILTLILTRE